MIFGVRCPPPPAARKIDHYQVSHIIRIDEHLKIPPAGGLSTAEKNAEQEYWSKRNNEYEVCVSVMLKRRSPP
jgi:hypothetical protein